METLLLYLVGCAIMAVAVFIFRRCNYADEENKKLAMYEATKYGLLSWLGLIVWLAFMLTACCCAIDETIEQYLKK